MVWLVLVLIQAFSCLLWWLCWHDFCISRKSCLPDLTPTFICVRPPRFSGLISDFQLCARCLVWDIFLSRLRVSEISARGPGLFPRRQSRFRFSFARWFSSSAKLLRPAHSVPSHPSQSVAHGLSRFYSVSLIRDRQERSRRPSVREQRAGLQFAPPGYSLGFFGFGFPAKILVCKFRA
jgi:hypothetical protein